MTRRAIVTIGALLVPLGTAGCFEYSPVQLGELAPGQDVRAYMTASHADELGQQIGRDDREIVGRVLETGGDEILFEVRTTAVREGRTTRYLTQRIAVPRAELIEVSERRLDGFRTALAAGAVVGAAGAIIAINLSQGRNSPLNDGRDPPEAVIIPLIRLRLPDP